MEDNGQFIWKLETNASSGEWNDCFLVLNPQPVSTCNQNYI